MGADIGAMAISHLEEVSDDGIDAMAKAGCIATILPTTAYILRLKQPPVRKMIEKAVPVALGTDFNPNAFCLSMVSVNFQNWMKNRQFRGSLEAVVFSFRPAEFETALLQICPILFQVVIPT
jgi:predicted amidohydrolase YtcJ